MGLYLFCYEGINHSATSTYTTVQIIERGGEEGPID